MKVALFAISLGLYRCGPTGSENNIAALISEGDEYIKKIRNLWTSSELFSAGERSKSKS